MKEDVVSTNNLLEEGNRKSSKSQSNLREETRSLSRAFCFISRARLTSTGEASRPFVYANGIMRPPAADGMTARSRDITESAY